MNRTILVIVVIGVIAAVLIFALNQGSDTDVVVVPEVTEPVPQEPEATGALTEPNNEPPADGNTDTPQQ